MRFTRSPSKNIRQWHSWFAWRPVTVTIENGQDFADHAQYIAWLERIERRAEFGGYTPNDDQIWRWYYRFPVVLPVTKAEQCDCNQGRLECGCYKRLYVTAGQAKPKLRPIVECSVCGEPGCPDHM